MQTDLRYPVEFLAHDIYCFLDSDVVPKVNEYIAAVESMGESDFATGHYRGRGVKERALGMIVGARFKPLSLSEVDSHATVDWAGGGLLFITKQALSKVPFPYFHEGIVGWKDDTGRERATIIGEDVVFCIAVRRTGVALRVIPSLSGKHLTGEGDDLPD